MKIPCRDCITLAICKASFTHEIDCYRVVRLLNKCSLLYKYLKSYERPLWSEKFDEVVEYMKSTIS
jgi:hypothetical protein